VSRGEGDSDPKPRPLAFTLPLSTCQKRVQTSKTDNRRTLLKPEEIRKLDAYFKRVFQNPKLMVKARPRKDDSAEVYLGDEFLGIVFKDEDDGDYNFSMAILDIDLA
jgi:hypothetical protein